MAQIEIQDTGRGIAAEHTQRIFQLFFTTRPGGSGIGLASTFRTVQLHNGSIDFKSESGARHDVSNRAAACPADGVCAFSPARYQRGSRAEYMMLRTQFNTLLYAIVLGGLGLTMAGCANKHIVRAAPPSVVTPPPDVAGPMPQPEAPAPTETKSVPPPEATPTAPPLAPVKRPSPPRPRTAPTEAADPAPPKPAPPQISPQLSPKDLESAKNNTTANITMAEKNLQLANGKQLNAAQKDLTGKIGGFLAQAHEAILADDWVRAANLAEKARVLSSELVKSF